MGLLIGLSWFIISINYILKSDNLIRRVFSKLNLKNTLSENNFQNIFCDMDEDERLYQKFLDLTEKEKSLSDLKNKLKDFRDNLEHFDFSNENEESKKER